MSSILRETGKVIDRFFGVEKYGKSEPHYQHKQSCLHVSNHPSAGLDGKALVTDLYAQIETNWRQSRAKYGKAPSKENWRFTGRSNISKRNTSPEVTLERAIIRSSNGDWANQVPTSSGLTHQSFDKRRCIDLVHRLDQSEWEFIELKIKSDTPFYAAMEILSYGILYLFSREHQQELKYNNKEEVLRASRIHLKVLAPDRFYSPNGSSTPYQLKWLEDLLNEGLRRFLDAMAGLALQISFQFEAFPPDFEWKATTKVPLNGAVDAALRGRHAFYAH